MLKSADAAHSGLSSAALSVGHIDTTVPRVMAVVLASRNAPRNSLLCDVTWLRRMKSTSDGAARPVRIARTVMVTTNSIRVKPRPKVSLEPRIISLPVPQ